MEATKEQQEQYIKDLKILARAKAYIDRTIGEEAGLDYMLSEIRKYVDTQKFSPHCYEYAEKTDLDLTEAEIAEKLPKTWDDRPIWSHQSFK